MKTFVAIIIKFVGVWILAWVAFSVFGTAAFWTVFAIACAVTVFNYLIGDLWILPNWGNVWASIVNGVIAGIAAWAVFYYTPAAYNYGNWIWIFAVAVAVAEFFYHMYLISAGVVEKKRSDSALYKKDKPNYNTESGSELYPYSRRANTGGNMDSLSGGRFKNENNFGDGNYNADGSDTGNDWYQGDTHGGNVENGDRYGGSVRNFTGSDKGNSDGSGGGRKNGKNKTK
jgi:hypothetical protein